MTNILHPNHPNQLKKSFTPTTKPIQYEAGADFDTEGKYRFLLWRKWKWSSIAPKPKMVNFLMLNPSTADAATNDPTVERCQRRAQMMGYDGIYVTNIFALRSTDPKKLKKVLDPVGKGNDQTILRVATDSELIICAWGSGGKYMNRGEAVLKLLHDNGFHATALKLNEDGTPQHPLYLPYEAQPILIENYD